MEIINMGHSNNCLVKVEVTWVQDLGVFLMVFLETFDQHLMEKLMSHFESKAINQMLTQINL
jgi:hypothetical protein